MGNRGQSLGLSAIPNSAAHRRELLQPAGQPSAAHVARTDTCVALTVLKHHLDRVKAEFSAEQYYHIGDTNMDQHYAERNGFAYFYPDASVDHLWIPA